MQRWWILRDSLSFLTFNSQCPTSEESEVLITFFALLKNVKSEEVAFCLLLLIKLRRIDPGDFPWPQHRWMLFGLPQRGEASASEVSTPRSRIWHREDFGIGRLPQNLARHISATPVTSRFFRWNTMDFLWWTMDKHGSDQHGTWEFLL